ncbi:MAG: hypothetical protein RSG86_01620 [Oscillospiraceae bacterium]
MKNELQTLRLFSPLFPILYRRNEWGGLENEPEDLTSEELLEYKSQIHDLIQKAQLPCEEKHGLAIYLDEALSRKVSSIYPDVEESSGKLWCVTEIKTYGELTATEYAELTDWLTGQFSDGWGEGLEQREIELEDGELYVSFWDASNRFFIKPEDEMPPEHSFGLTMGGR